MESLKLGRRMVSSRPVWAAQQDPVSKIPSMVEMTNDVVEALGTVSFGSQTPWEQQLEPMWH
jgi:hypothetical protein